MATKAIHATLALAMGVAGPRSVRFATEVMGRAVSRGLGDTSSMESSVATTAVNDLTAPLNPLSAIQSVANNAIEAPVQIVQAVGGIVSAFQAPAVEKQKAAEAGFEAQAQEATAQAQSQGVIATAQSEASVANSEATASETQSNDSSKVSLAQIAATLQVATMQRSASDQAHTDLANALSNLQFAMIDLSSALADVRAAADQVAALYQMSPDMDPIFGQSASSAVAQANSLAGQVSGYLVTNPPSDAGAALSFTAGVQGVIGQVLALTPDVAAARQGAFASAKSFWSSGRAS